MRLLTKVMTGVSLAALSVVIAGGADAQAAASKGATFNADKNISGIEVGNMVSFDAVKDKKGTPTWNAKAKWDTYYADTDVDLSNLKTTKDSYITVKTSDKSGDVYTVYKIAKDTVKKYKGIISASGALGITADGAAVTPEDCANYEYRTATGSWKAIEYDKKNDEISFSVTPYEQQGATLYFRYKGQEISPAENTDSIAGAPEGTTLNDIAANSFVGKEFKVKVPKMGNAPAIAVDYNKGIIKEKKKAEYRVGTFTSSEGDWADSKAYTVDSSEAGSFQLRTKATDKKAASKIAVYNWKAVDAPEVKDIVDSKTGELEAAKGDIIEKELSYDTPEAADEKKATFKITNTTTGDTAKTIILYSAKVDSKGKVESVDTTKAVATLAAGKSVTFKTAKVKDGTTLVAIYAGNKKTDTLPSVNSESAVTVKYNIKAAEEEDK